MPLRSSITVVVTAAALASSACASVIYDNDLSPDDRLGMGFPNDPRRAQPGSVSAHPLVRTVAEWDFEPASPDCNGWSATGATAIRAAPPHSGAYACKLCADGSAPEMRLSRRVAGLARGRWVASAWLRQSGGTVAATAAHVTLEDVSEAAGLPPRILDVDEWRLLGDPREVDVDIASATLTVVATASPGDCVLVDDVAIESATAEGAQSSRPATPYAFLSR